MECQRFTEQGKPYNHKADLKPVKEEEKESEFGKGEPQLQMQTWPCPPTQLTVLEHRWPGRGFWLRRNGARRLAEGCLGGAWVWFES